MRPFRITSYNVCYTKLLRIELLQDDPDVSVTDLGDDLAVGEAETAGATVARLGESGQWIGDVVRVINSIRNNFV